MSFNQLDLSSPLLNAINERGDDKSIPVQQQVVHLILQEQDFLTIAQTGTGKTVSFALPLLHLLYNQSLPEKIHPFRY